MANVAYNCLVSITGTSTALTDEPMTDTGDGITWRVTDATKRILDPAVALTFEDNAVAIASGDIESIDYLLGTVTFTGVKVGPITIATGSYLPFYTITDAYEFNIAFSRAMADTTAFSDTAHVRLPLLLDASGEISIHDIATTDYDTTGASRTILAVLEGATPIILSFRLSTTATNVYRARAVVVSFETSGSAEDLIEGTISWELAAVMSVDGFPVSFSWSDT